MHTILRNKLGMGVLLLLVVVLLGAGLVHGEALASADLAPVRAPLAASLAASLPATPCTTAGTTTTCNLWAVAGSITLPDASTVTVWGYAGESAPSSGTPGPVSVPGPVLIVNQGNTVTVNLTNNLTEATAMMFQGQAMVPDLTGAAAGGTHSYTFTATNPGTYLYEAGFLSDAQHQVALSLYGALVVRSGTAGQAYNNAATAFNDEALVVLGEVDPALNNRPTPATFDMRDYAPKYYLINGKAYPNTAPIVTAAGGNKVLLRYVNAGLQPHSMALLGMSQTVVAVAGSLATYSHTMVAETIGPGQTADVIATVPASAMNGSKFAVYDGSFTLRNNNIAGFGGMLTFLTVGASTPPTTDTIGPATSAATLNPAATNGTVAVLLTASVSDVATGGSNIQAAEYFIDTTGANGGGTAMTGAFASPTEAVQATIAAATLAGLSSGNHTVYVHGQDSAGNWGSFNPVVLNLDKSGPTTTGLGLLPNPGNGSVAMTLSATGDDRFTGNSNIQAAEYFIGAAGGPGTGSVMVVNAALPIASLTATIPAAPVNALAHGTYVASVHIKDALGNCGAFATITLSVDKTGPATSGVNAAPNPNNGTLGVNSSTPAVRVTASFTDGMSSISAAEGFIDTVGANGAGFPFVAGDGLFNSLTETGRADIPLTTIAALSQGNHTLYVHAKDKPGNWGPASSTVLVIDKVGPAVSGLALNPSATNNTAVAISAAASDVTTGNSNIASGEYFIDAGGANGTGTVMTVSAPAPSANLNGTIAASVVAALTAGNHTIYVHAKDAGGTWGALVSTILLIDRTPPTFSGITLTPNSIAAGTASVGLAVTSATDPLVGGLASGVTGGEYWVCPTTCTNPGTGGGTAFIGLSATVPTASLPAWHPYTVRARIRGAAGNWSTGVNSAVLTVTAANNIFTDGFESGTLPGSWSGRSTTTTSRLNVTTGAALFGAFGMQAQGNASNYLQNNFSPVAAIYDARFYFRPNGNTSTGKDIFAVATSNAFGTIAFRVRYRLNGTTPQVQVQVGATNTNAAWANISGGTANNVIEVVWQAVGSGGPNPGTLVLYVNGVLSQTLTATSNSAGAARLGSITATGDATLMYFDAFASKRTASPLFGP